MIYNDNLKGKIFVKRRASSYIRSDKTLTRR